MEYSPPSPPIPPRLIIHGGAGNVTPVNVPPERYAAFWAALLAIVTRTNAYMLTPSKHAGASLQAEYPSALEIATFAVTQLENNPLFNSGHGAVFTRDGINELEASVMVSRGFKKRGVGATGLRRVKNPILLAKAMLEHGDQDLGGDEVDARTMGSLEEEKVIGNAKARFEHDKEEAERELDIPSAQGHTLVHGETAEVLAKQYGLELVETSYFFTQKRWDEHIRALEREKAGNQELATWSAEEYLPQGTCGAVALDRNGVVCTATSTGGMTNKLTGRIGDTPIVGAGFWAEQWSERGDPSGDASRSTWKTITNYLSQPGPVIEFSASLRGLMADCLPTPFMYTPVQQPPAYTRGVRTIRSAAVSGTGNGDSFLRVNAARTVTAIARWAGVSTSKALHQVAGIGGELQQSAGSRWGKTGEGEGGIIGIESAIVVDDAGRVIESRSEVLRELNCGGMFTAYIDEEGNPVVKIWKDD